LNRNEDLYARQLKGKKDLFFSFFSDLTKNLNYFPSPPSHFRTRAELGVHASNNIQFTMVENNKKINVDQLMICDAKINQFICQLKTKLLSSDEIKEKLFQTEIQVSRSGEGIVSLIYHKPLDTNWIKKAKKLSSEIGASIIGRSRKQKLVIGKDFVTETYNAHIKKIKVNLYEQCFSQPNPYICDEMLTWVSKNKGLHHHVTELHCGVGTFTILLSNLYSRVLATENSRPSIKALEKNIQINSLENVETARMSGLETLEALNKKREFNRMKHLNLINFKKDVLFLDPPRSGLDVESINLIKELQFKEIIYLSCGFQSLKSNLKEFLTDYKVKKAALFDQFPYTDHIETGVILSKL
jgi:tRNA (uracil-5-)-methyltransferase